MSQLGPRVLLAPNGSKPGPLINILQYTGQLLRDKEFSCLIRAVLEKLGLEEIELEIVGWEEGE